MCPASSCSTTISERRSVIVPPEITNGSTSGSVSWYSSARAIRVIVRWVAPLAPGPQQQPGRHEDHDSTDDHQPAAAARGDQPADRADGQPQREDLHVHLLDPGALLTERPDTPSREHHDRDPTNDRFAGIDGATPRQDSRQGEEQHTPQLT